MAQKQKRRSLWEKFQGALAGIGEFVRKKQNRLMALLMVVVVICVAFVAQQKAKQQQVQETMVRQAGALEIGADGLAHIATEKPEATPNPEEGIYTYLQGPKSWGQRIAWSGVWGERFYDGGSFGGFGCGLCCIANIYSSLTGYQCTPVDAYSYAKRETDYSGGGAIEWGYLRQTLSSLGFDCEVKKKPDSYEEFKKSIAESKCAIVLVSSADSKCYWKDTPGHYVTVFLYGENGDKIFLADSGDPDHNRSWVPLKKIYKSLKTASGWQYLPVYGYEKEKDGWRHKKAEGNWVRP